MKLIVAGSTGFLGKEIITQALAHPTITTVVALGRRPADIDETKNKSKLVNAVVPDFDHYSDDVKKQLADADALIWFAH
jgi:nucleoside-diphosphate-sugar epimerase